MKNKQIKIAHCATVQAPNPEAAKPGEAADTLNLRQRADALEAVGIPLTRHRIAQGSILLCLDGDRVITLSGNQVLSDGNVIATVAGTVIDACVTGSTLVVSTSQEIIYLHRTADGYVRLDPEQLAPILHLAAVDTTQLTAQIDAYEFSEPYSRWQAPLAANDLVALTRLAAAAHRSIERTAAGAGVFTSPVLCRYAVRAFDDHYLWVSQPVLVGGEVLTSNYRTTAQVQNTSNDFTGIDGCTVTRNAFKLGVTVLGGVPQQWHRVVKAIDIFVTDSPSVIQDSTIDYRCSINTVGTRLYLLEYGPQPQSRTAIAHALLHARWHRIATTSHLDSLTNGTFVTANAGAAASTVFPGLTTWTVSRQLVDTESVSNAYFEPVNHNMAHRVTANTILAHNGRLHMGGCTLQWVNPWHPVTLFAGTMTQQPCHVATAVTLKTDQGAATLVRHDEVPYTPQALNPCLSTLQPHATSLRIEVTTATGTKVCEMQVVQQGTLGLAVDMDLGLQNHQLVSGNSVIPQSSTGCVAIHPGRIRSYAIDNPFVLEFQHDVSGCSIAALAAAAKPIYSGGLGRYPLYAFTQCGIFALPQSTAGKYGEARLVHNAALASGTMPVQGDQCIWFVSDKQVLYDLCGTRLTRHLGHCQATQFAWNTVEQELWMRQDDDSLQLLMPGDYTTRLTLQAVQLWSRDACALAVDVNGCVMDLTVQEPVEACPVYYRSHPIVLDPLMRTTVNAIVWNLFASQARLQLSVTGERGTSCHGFKINTISLHGAINAPLCLPIVAQPLRSLRLSVDGTVPSGTLLLPTSLNTLAK